jgi:YVTN family beta-propeller protein
MIRRFVLAFCILGFLGVALSVSKVFAAQTPSPALLVLDKEDNALSIIDPASLKTLAVIPTGRAPHELTVSSDGKIAYVANYGAETPGETLSVIDLAAQKEIRRVDLGDLRRPHGIEFVGGKVYFTS